MDDSELQSLVGDERTARALATVLARAENGDGTVQWAGVSDVIEAEVWGRLVTSGVLVPVEDAFVIDDPPTVRTALNDADVEITADAAECTDIDVPSGWRPVDKVAGMGALVLMAGYQVSPIKSTVAGGVNLLLGPVAGVLPFPAVVTLLAVAVAILSTVVRGRLVDQDRVSAHREQMKRVKERLKAAKERGDEAAIERLSERQEEMMRKQFGIMKHTFRPMAWTMLVTVPVFLWLSWIVVAPNVAIGTTTPALPMVGRLVWTARIVGPMKLWMAWYLLNMLVSNLLAKRAMKRVTRPAATA